MGQAINKLLASAGNPKPATLPTPQPGVGYGHQIANAAGNFFSNLAAQTGHMIVYAGTRIAGAGVQTYNEFQNPGYDTPVDTGNPQRANAGGTATPLPINAAPQGVQTSQSETKLAQPTQILGSTIPAQQTGAVGAEQIAGQGIEAAGTIGGIAAGGMLNPELGIGTRFIQGAGVGAPAGGLIGAGQAMENGGSALDVAKGAGGGVIAGGIGGGVLNAVLPPVFGKISDYANGVKPTETPTVETPKLSPEQQDIQNNITQSQKDLEQAKSQADFAAEQRKSATPQAVQGVQDINTKVSGNLKTLGTQFGNDAAALEKSNPNLKLNLTNEQVDALNALKENKNFSLPDKINRDTNSLTVKGTGLDLTNATPEMKAQIAFKLGQSGGQTSVSLSPTEAQDLIKELNRSTFRQNADGSLTKDYGRIGITNEIKQSASQAFGPEWDKIYSTYSQGRGMIDKIDSIVNLDPKATPEDLNKQLEGILKQSKTPEGKLLLQQAVDEYKQSSGIDLKDPIKSIQQIADKQTALDTANAKLSDAQKATFKAQRDADIAKLKQEQKMSTFKGRHPTLTQNGNYFLKRAAWGLTGGTIIGALGLSGLLKKLFK